MNRAEAKRLSYTITYQELIGILEKVDVSALTGASRINPSITKVQAYTILRDGLESWHKKSPNRLDTMTATNILREFGGS